MSKRENPYVGSGQPDPLEAFTALYLQLIKHCLVETRLWFDLREYSSSRKKRGWTDIDVLGIGKDLVYIVQCKTWPENNPKSLSNQFELMHAHAMKIHKSAMTNRPRHYVLSCTQAINKKTEQRLRQQLSNTPWRYFEVWTFTDMARELILYVYKNCMYRSLKLDNPMMWLLKNLVWYDFIIEKAGYVSDWKIREGTEVYADFWSNVHQKASTREYHDSLAELIKESLTRDMKKRG